MNVSQGSVTSSGRLKAAITVIAVIVTAVAVVMSLPKETEEVQTTKKVVRLEREQRLVRVLRSRWM